MKRSFLTVLAASSILVLGACGGADEEEQIEPVQEVAPPPAPMPMDSPVDTMVVDTTMTTTG
ncbi:MAG TPA: hypothetical protein VMN60_04150 [Longimicrobiales bacterium]|nr:hypothetical protein [Longimicrobiales bacterium]